tara:strand:- start:3026 stop:3430 length:405 start_codon:yes stop_codon:yes gene_type:complete
MKIDFKIPLSCVACPRPRVTSRGVYYPKRYQEFKKRCVQYMKVLGIQMEKDKFLHVEYTIVLKRIYQMSVKKYGSGRVFKPSRPDLDNFVKSLNDCMQEAGMIADDSQIVSFKASKYYGATSESPVIEMSITIL